MLTVMVIATNKLFIQGNGKLGIFRLLKLYFYLGPCIQ